MDAKSLVSAIQEAAHGTPYTITATEHGFTLSLNIVDEKWYTLLYKNGIKKIFMIDVKLKEFGLRAATTDMLYELDWKAGVGVTDLKPSIGGKINVQKGEIISFQKRKEFGVSENGKVGKTVDFTFSSSEAKSWLDAQLAKGGWNRAIGLETKIAFWVASTVIFLLVFVMIPMMIWQFSHW